jgi:hypothetical protein
VERGASPGPTVHARRARARGMARRAGGACTSARAPVVDPRSPVARGTRAPVYMRRQREQEEYRVAAGVRMTEARWVVLHVPMPHRRGHGRGHHRRQRRRERRACVARHALSERFYICISGGSISACPGCGCGYACAWNGTGGLRLRTGTDVWQRARAGGTATLGWARMSARTAIGGASAACAPG